VRSSSDLYTIIFTSNFCIIFNDAFPFLNNVIDYTMSNALIKEPKGIFKCFNGFPMRSHFSAVARDLILLVSEYKIFIYLQNLKLRRHVHRYIRLRDDLILSIKSDLRSVIETLEVIFTGYPSTLEFTLISIILKSKFLDMKLFANPVEYHNFWNFI